MEVTIWSHPITVLLVASLLGISGFILKIIWDLSGTQKATTAILDLMKQRQDECDNKLDTVIGDVRELLGAQKPAHQKKTA